MDGGETEEGRENHVASESAFWVYASYATLGKSFKSTGPQSPCL